MKYTNGSWAHLLSSGKTKPHGRYIIMTMCIVYIYLCLMMVPHTYSNHRMFATYQVCLTVSPLRYFWASLILEKSSNLFVRFANPCATSEFCFTHLIKAGILDTIPSFQLRKLFPVIWEIYSSHIELFDQLILKYFLHFRCNFTGFKLAWLLHN